MRSHLCKSSGQIRRLTPIVSFALAFGLLWPDAQADPPIPVDPTLTDPVLLRLQFVPERLDTYRIRYGGEGSLTARLHMDETRWSFNTALLERQTVRTVDADGNGIAFFELDEIELNRWVDEEPADPEDVEPVTEGLYREIRRDMFGRVLEDQLMLDMGGGLDGDSRDFLGLVDLHSRRVDLRFPDRSLDVGEMWTQTFENHRHDPEGGIEDTTVGQFTFLGYADISGIRTAVVYCNLQTWVEISDTAVFGDITGPALGRGIGEGYLYFGVDNGSFESGQIEYGFVFRAQPTGTTATDIAGTVLMEFERVH